MTMKRQPPPIRPPKPDPYREANAHAAMDAYAKGELVRTAFDRVFPGMPPALKLGR